MQGASKPGDELQRLVGKTTMEREILKEALEIASRSKTPVALALVAEGRFAMTAACETLGVARPNIAQRVKQRPSTARGRLPLANQELLDQIKTVIDDIAGFRRSCAVKPAAKTAHAPMPSASTG